MYQWRANARIRPCACAGLFESAHFAHAQTVFAWRVPYSVATLSRLARSNMYRIYPKYSDTSTPYHICSKI